MDEWQSVADSHGLLSAADARRTGLSSRDLGRLVKTEALIRLGHGWFSLPFEVNAADTTWERRRRLHAAQARAILRAFDGRVVASHHSALVLHGLPTFAADLRQVHVTRVSSVQSRRRPGLTVHQSVPGASFTDGVLDVADACVGTGRTNGDMAALIAADAALHRNLVSRADLQNAAARIIGPGSAIIRGVAAAADGRAESPGETRLRRALTLMGYRVEPQYVIADGSFLAIVDFLLEDYDIAVEFDGFVKYGRRDPLSISATPADVVFEEKRREDHVRGLGYGMARVIWWDLEDLPRLHRQIEAAIESTGRRPRSA
jgi:hypothetical protein